MNNDHSITTRLLPLPHPASWCPPSWYHYHLSLPSPPAWISPIPWFHDTSTAEISIPVAAAQIGSSSFELHLCASWRSKPKKTCFSPKELLFRTFPIGITLLSIMHTLGVGCTAIASLLQPDTGYLEMTRKIWFQEGFIFAKAAAIGPVQWLYLDTTRPCSP